MTTQIIVRLETKYNQTNFKQLLELGRYEWDRFKKRAVWTFPLNNLRRAIALLGHTIEIDPNDLKLLSNYAPPIGPGFSVPRYKSKGFVRITKAPKVYVIKTLINKEEKTYLVPIENVQAAANVITSYKKFTKVKSSTVAERIIRELGIIRFDRLVSGTFDWAKFFGNRKDYYNYFYLPMKVLEAKHFIKHHKNGRVERVKDEFTENEIICTRRAA